MDAPEIERLRAELDRARDLILSLRRKLHDGDEEGT
jgi:hypothetical protein